MAGAHGGGRRRFRHRFRRGSSMSVCD
ncbi:uncharacterized protein G2W53_037291 [Senna tora]|uniref:Uncharacterized protein n=1 Tax=Senna tora TaxID=362788 RepID=A0A834SU36_9FABA|nr:uncharacterized protein G2W53_037291 [Senna tora]